MKSPIAVVVLAAGAGTRMKSAVPKVLHPLAGWPMVRHVLENVAQLKPARIIGVVTSGASAKTTSTGPRWPLSAPSAALVAWPVPSGLRCTTVG